MLAGIKFGGWVPNGHCKDIGGFKFGDSVRDCHSIYASKKFWQIFNLAVAQADCQTAKFLILTMIHQGLIYMLLDHQHVHIL